MSYACSLALHSSFLSLIRCHSDPLVSHGRHFCRTVHALCNVKALLTNGMLRLGELAEESEESFTAECALDPYLADSSYMSIAEKGESIVYLGYFYRWSQVWRLGWWRAMKTKSYMLLRWLVWWSSWTSIHLLYPLAKLDLTATERRFNSSFGRYKESQRSCARLDSSTRTVNHSASVA